MRPKILNVFQEKRLGPMVIQNSGDLEKKRAFDPIAEPMISSEACILRNPGDRKRLTGKAGQQNVMRRNINGWNSPDVAFRRVAKVFPVSLACKPIDFGCEDTRAASDRKAQAHTADPGEQIDEFEVLQVPLNQ